MQADTVKEPVTWHRARPATGSAFLTGQIVIVTTPSMATGENLLAIGDRWTELRVTQDERRREVTSDV